MEASGIAVHCACDEIVDIGSVIPNPRNPNTHPDQQLELLAKVIASQGWRQPITLSKRSRMVVRGHGRLAAAHLLGVSQVPVDWQDYDSAEAELADLVADNRLAELAVIDTGQLKDLLLDLDSGCLDMDLTGFTYEDLERLMCQVHPDEDTLEDVHRALGLSASQAELLDRAIETAGGTPAEAIVRICEAFLNR